MSEFSIIDHTADMGLEVRGKTLEKLFENTARYTIQLAVKVPGAPPTESVEVHLSGSDLEDLLVRWLGEILYLFEGEKKIATGIRVTAVSRQHLDATLQIIPYDPDLHELLSEIKAVTYHQIRVSRKNDRSWEARVIFDI
jgi:SHS2 domain-containing protein